MKIARVCSVLAVLLLATAVADAQVAWSTGVVGFQLRNAGAVRFGAPVWSSVRHLDRTSLVAALDTGHVFDQAQDANVFEAASFIPVAGVDTAATNVSDNSFSGASPKIKVRTTIYGWHSDTYVIIRYTVTNDTSVSLPLYLGTAVIPRVANTYGLETVQYDAARQVAYYFRGSEAVYVGFKYLEGAPSSFHALDWNVYSPDPASDLATDARRYAMTAPAGFDAPLTGGADGTIFNLNAGLRTIPPGQSVTISYAMVFAPDLTTMLNEADSAQARFSALVPPEVHDIGVVRLRQDLPAGAAENAPVTLRAAIQNNGAFIESAYQIAWTVDGIPQTPVANSVPLAVGGRDTLPLTWASPSAGLHTVRAWTVLATDSIPSNDSSSVVGVFITPPFTIFEERFNGTFPPAGWSTVNRDGGGSTGPWAQGTATRFPSAEGPENGFAGDAYTTANGLYIDDYLISPNMGTTPDPTGADSLIFYVRSFDSAFLDSLEIRLSTTGADTADFTVMLDYIEVPKTGWTRYAYLLPQAAARYIAFRYLMYDGGTSGTNSVYIGLDLVHVLRYGGTNTIVQVPLGTGWNLVSNPVITTADSMRQLFPQSVLDYGFGFSSAGGYTQAPQLEGGRGYWGKMAGPHTQAIAGGVRTSVTIPVTQGWNMVGALSATVDTSAAHVTTVPPGLRTSNFFRYNPSPAPGYAVASELVPGSGYWVKMSGAGTISITFPGPDAAPANAGPGIGALHRITVTDARGHVQSLYFGDDAALDLPTALFELPPPPPDGALDARFGNGGMVQTLSPADAPVLPVTLRGAVYPLTVSWAVQADGRTWSVTDAAGTLPPVTLTGEGAVRIALPVAGLLLAAAGGEGLPAEFALGQNYPNPFNPATTATFDLPVSARISVEVFDMLGRRVATLAAGMYAAGRHTASWDGTTSGGRPAGSGTYFLRFTATGDAAAFTAVRKMLLMK